MPGKYTMRSKEEKLSVVMRNLSGESACSLARELGCDDRQVRNWVKLYQAEGEVGLEPKKKPSITSTTNALFVNLKENHQPCLEQNWWLV